MSKVINAHRHWPVSPTQCICGDRFRNPDRHLEHQRVFMGDKYARGPRWTARDGVKTATVAPGHVLSFLTGLSLLPHMNKVVCTCGWSRYTATAFPGPYGRQHTRGLVRAIIYDGAKA